MKIAVRSDKLPQKPPKALLLISYSGNRATDAICFIPGIGSVHAEEQTSVTARTPIGAAKSDTG